MAKKANPDAPYWRQVAEAERRIIAYAFENASSMSHAAQVLGVSRAFLIEKARELNIPPPNPTRVASTEEGKAHQRASAKRNLVKANKAAGRKEPVTDDDGVLRDAAGVALEDQPDNGGSGDQHDLDHEDRP